jgi:hypothetical protein
MLCAFCEGGTKLTIYPDDGGSIFLRNMHPHLPDYAVNRLIGSLSWELDISCKGTLHPATGWGGPRGSGYDFLAVRHYEGDRSSAFCTGRLYHRRNPWYSFSEAESTPGHMVPSGGATEKIHTDTTGNWSWDRSALITVLPETSLVETLNYPFKPLKAELNPICHLLALLGAHRILHVSRIRVNQPFIGGSVVNYLSHWMTMITVYTICRCSAVAGFWAKGPQPTVQFIRRVYPSRI